MIQACDLDRVSFTWISPHIGDQAFAEEWPFLSVTRIQSPLQGRGRLSRAAFGMSAAQYLIQHRHTCDLVYCPQSYMPTDLVSLIARFIKKPVVVRIAAGELSATHHRGQLRRWLLPRLANALVVLNHELLAQLKDPKHLGKIHWFPNGVDTERFHPPTPEQRDAARKQWQVPEDAKMILFVGSIVPSKGVDTLVSAFIDVAKQKGSMLVLAGPVDKSVEFTQQLLHTIHVKNLGEQVRFLGRTSDVGGLMQATDIFVLPSLAEGMPNALLETMSTGLPCVASDIPGVRELIISGDNGLLFSPHDSNQLAGHLVWLINNPAESRKLGCRARATVEDKFSIKRTARGYQELFLELASSIGRTK